MVRAGHDYRLRLCLAQQLLGLSVPHLYSKRPPSALSWGIVRRHFCVTGRMTAE